MDRRTAMTNEQSPVAHQEIEIHGVSWNLTYRVSDGTPLLLSENRFENPRSYRLGTGSDVLPQPQRQSEPPNVGKFLATIAEGLRHAIRDHGPITKEHIGSAAKRVWGRIREMKYDPFRVAATGAPYDDSEPVLAALEQVAEDGYATDNHRAAARMGIAEIERLRAATGTEEGEESDDAARLAAYQQEYERLFNWRDLWNRLSNSKRFTLASQNDRIEEKAARANRLIGKLIAEYDAATPPAPSVAETNQPAINLLDRWLAEHPSVEHDEYTERMHRLIDENSLSDRERYPNTATASDSVREAAALQIAEQIVVVWYDGTRRPVAEVTNEIAAIISRCIPNTGAQTYHCSCGGALTAEEYLEHYFQKGHDRGERKRPDVGWALRELADGWIDNNQREGPYGFYRNARRVLEAIADDARANAVREGVELTRNGPDGLGGDWSVEEAVAALSKLENS